MGIFSNILSKNKSSAKNEKTNVGRSTPQNKVFGEKILYEIPSGERCANYVNGLPIVVYSCLGYLYQCGMKVEGLFRISASHDEVNKIISMYDNGENVNLHNINICSGPHVAASLLKKYFRMLPEPLFIFDTYEFLITVSKNKKLSQNEKLEQIKRITNTLPTVNFETLGVLMLFLNDLAKNYGINKMDSMNIAICFAPNLLRLDEDNGHKDVLDTGDATLVIRMLIDESTNVFNNVNSKITLLQKRLSTYNGQADYMGMGEDIELDDMVI